MPGKSSRPPPVVGDGVVEQKDIIVDEDHAGTLEARVTAEARARVEGFIVSRWGPRFGEGAQQMAQWLKEGKLKYHEDIIEGFENTPKAFIEMLGGKNLGKMLVKA